MKIRKALYTASNVEENTFISNFRRIIDKWLKCGRCSKTDRQANENPGIYASNMTDLVKQRKNLMSGNIN